MNISSICTGRYQIAFEAITAPVQLIYGIFLQAIGYLLLCFGAREWGANLKDRGARIDNSMIGLFEGIWAYGRRFLVHTDNFEEVCRGSCYWFIDEHLRDPEKPLEEIAVAFTGGPPEIAIQMHRQYQIPVHLEETKIWQEEGIDNWPAMPNLDPGVYSFFLGYSKDANHPGKAHRFVLINQEEPFLFDPNTGLSIWIPSDWSPLLDRIASSIRTANAGFFTLECYEYKLMRNV